MSLHIPDRWIVVKLLRKGQERYKILASWYGGYLGSDSWRLSSDIESAKKIKHIWEFHNQSGSIYKCHQNGYGMSGYTTQVFLNYSKQNTEDLSISLVDEDDLVGIMAAVLPKTARPE